MTTLTNSTAAGSPATRNAQVFAELNAKSSSAAQGNKVLSTATEQNDRFLKLLTTQLTNQDPLNPLDNAQMTSQMAQISTVSGLEQLNAAITSLSGQFLQLQAMQGASLVGRDVLAQGDRLSLAAGRAGGGFSIDVPATSVTVEVLSPSGQVVQSERLGAKPAGQHTFDFKAAGLADDTAYSFRVVARNGDTDLGATELVRSAVKAVNTSGKTLALELANGTSVAYSAVQSIL
jgi:flagellar basal-body rod modification protein FlgD